MSSSRMNPRDRALITTMSRCGLRVSEACGLTVENIHWTSETPSLRFTGKRNRERIVPMNLEVQDVLRTWPDYRIRVVGWCRTVFAGVNAVSQISARSRVVDRNYQPIS